MTTLERILTSFHLPSTGRPIEIPNFGRDQLAELFHILVFNRGAEIGVWRGEYSEVLCKANPILKLICVDPWVPYAAYKDHLHPERLKDAYAEAKNRLAPYKCTIIRAMSLDASKDIPDRSLDFAYIDGNHAFRYAVDDIDEWSRKIRPGGIIAGHDYKHFKRQSHIRVVEAVHGYTAAHDIDPWFVLGTKAVVSDQIRDSCRSWMWVIPEKT